ncbi:MAG TPA: helix-turn-helix domain-containing protein [Terriglobales bacterium]|nr:helix-turn-helix domain-containing protein [Terriglobales bacterium]
MRKIGSETVSECPCEYALRYIGGAWKVLIVAHLTQVKIRRHAEIKRLLRGITPKILTQQLREMERDGLIQRTVYAEVPPRVEYQLTAFGETLRPVLEAMYAWGKQTQEAASRPTLTTNANAGGTESQRHSDSGCG